MTFIITISKIRKSIFRLSLFICLWIIHDDGVQAMRVTRPWSTKHWCDSVRKPEWPFAYSKYHGQVEETKGRVSTNEQDMRHECDLRGVQSKCHICEDIDCGENMSMTCNFQIQGIHSDEMSINIPTVTDVPWAVEGRHRYDFRNASHICMYQSGGTSGCSSAFLLDYAHCELRCWGYNSSIPSKKSITTISHTSSWTPKQLTDVWEYPKFLSPNGNYSELYGGTLPFSPKNPYKYGNIPFIQQGYVFTLAGSLNGEEGFRDGEESYARFRHPEGIAVDDIGYVYVADTGNHAVRVISPTGYVKTLVGDGFAGSKDGSLYDNPRLSSPTDIAVVKGTESPDSQVILFLTDTGNHRIRKIRLNFEEIEAGQRIWKDIEVSCFAGLCNNKTSPTHGYSDGVGKEARFNSPRGLDISSSGDIFVADTNNHLIRKVNQRGEVFTLAGSTTIAETNSRGEPLEGCVPPCLAGLSGHEDGPLLSTKFEYPYNLAVGKVDGKEEPVVYVTDQHFIRKLNLTSDESSTVSGQMYEGERDGEGTEATFNKPTGIAVTPNGNIYITDTGSCRIRRLSRPLNTIPTILCTDSLQRIVRPSGCSSYDPPVDEFDFMNTACDGNMYRNYFMRNESSVTRGNDVVGRSIKNCVGSPPLDIADKKSWRNVSSLPPYNENLVIDDHLYNIREDVNVGTLMKVQCPSFCSDSPLDILGGNLIGGSFVDSFTGLYDESSSICGAAVHNGVVNNSLGGLVDILLERGTFTNISISHGLQNGVTSSELPLRSNRLFSLRKGSSKFLVDTVAGAPVTLLGDGCQYKDAMPPQESMFQTPTGIATTSNNLDNEKYFLYIADRNNHVIRAMSAVCSFVCENGGQCVASNTCDCPKGWGGMDCTKPLCENSTCNGRELCVAPETCSCIPGFEESDNGCTKPLCVQSCQNGGVCSSPDTCTCPNGWFDSNCTTPVCEQTCGNGGNCTNPNTCSCPIEWTGFDCRTPFCTQTCENGGWCVAPNTCKCSTGFTGHDCSEPVCQQGYFTPYTLDNTEMIKNWMAHVPCNMSVWCIETFGFDCSQSLRQSTLTGFKYGDVWRHLTGRKYPPDDCALIEVVVDAITHFPYLLASNHSTTSHHRFSPRSHYSWISDRRLPWNAYIEPTDNFTRPWTFQYDRQVAVVELRNITLGRYVCANGGSCVAPDVCACAPGWIGFDCRTPVCEAGYYESDQSLYVSSLHTRNELDIFEHFLGNNTYRLDPSTGGGRGYSNPIYLTTSEIFLNRSMIERSEIVMGDKAYLKLDGSEQGGYSCSIRSVTEWEHYRNGYLFEHPNFYSRYMDTKPEIDGINYTFWENMGLNATYEKTNKLVYNTTELGLQHNLQGNLGYTYTDDGYRENGEWRLNGYNWTKGVCIIEFKRVCEAADKAFDLESGPNEGVNVLENNLLVQDTDKAFRPRTAYNDKREFARGQWLQSNGQCVDHVIRGCFNNGTCIGPNTCQCFEGWKGYDCSIPICKQNCKHNGNCTLPDICTCEKGWSGYDCSIPRCSQDCVHGNCIAPDTCQCVQWENEWRDGRSNGGAPLFQKPNGDPQMTGWTGFDCSTPICVQAERFNLNLDTSMYSSEELSHLFLDLGGDIDCISDQCRLTDKKRTSNNGRSHQSGCGYDPFDTGCCELLNSTGNSLVHSYRCYWCNEENFQSYESVRICLDGGMQTVDFLTMDLVPLQFKDQLGYIMMCGLLHDNELDDSSLLVSDRFLCNRFEWDQGDYIDDAGLNETPGIGYDWGLKSGRHTRINYNNYMKSMDGSLQWKIGPEISGEGLFECFNSGSCIAPDTCHCKDGWSGFDCNTPLCRHTQYDGSLVGCLNGGICQDKDDCHCIQTISALWKEYDNVERGMTGWTGSDCSISICVQGFFDPFCDSPFAPGGEGCYRCDNGGLCVAPDVCQCDKRWTGFDCKTPICEMEATSLITQQLMTEDEAKIRLFETNPCSLEGIYEPEKINGIEYPRGKCMLPNKCACLCKGRKDKQYCKKFGGLFCRSPFHDPLYKHRNVLEPNELFGTRNCWSGYEGAVDEYDDFTSCHMVIYEPDYFTENTKDIIIGVSLSIVVLLISYWFIRRKFRQRDQRQRIERRKQRRDSLQNAFTHREIMTENTPRIESDSRPGTASSVRSRTGSTTSRARHTLRNR